MGFKKRAQDNLQKNKIQTKSEMTLELFHILLFLPNELRIYFVSRIKCKTSNT